jgi:hypothetical protein
VADGGKLAGGDGAAWWRCECLHRSSMCLKSLEKEIDGMVLFM